MAGRRRQEQKEETRRILLDTAFDLFQEKGYDRATMRELAARAGVAQGTIFLHFPDKPSLVIAAFETDMREVEDDCFSSVPPTDLKNQLLYITRRFYGVHQKRPALSWVLLLQAFKLEGERAEEMDNVNRRIIGRLAEVFQNAISRGELDQDIDIHDAALAYWSFYLIVLLSGLRRHPFDLEAMVDQVKKMLDILLLGLTTTSGS